MLYMVTWIPSIYPLYVSIYTSTMDPMGFVMVYWKQADQVCLIQATVLPSRTGWSGLVASEKHLPKMKDIDGH